MNDFIPSQVATDEQSREALLEQLPACVFLIDREGRCTYVNSAWEASLRCRRSDLLGFGWLSALHPHDRDRVPETWNKAVAGGRPFRGVYRMRKNGAWEWFLFHAAPTREGERVTGYCGLVSELSSRMAEASALLGQSLADELANALTVVAGNVELARATDDVPEELEEPHFLQAVEQALRLSRELLASDGPGWTRPTDIHHLLEQATQLIRRVLPREVVVELDLLAEKAHVELDPARLWRALACAALDARDTMPCGGLLRFQTTTMERGRLGSFLRLTIRDSGLGTHPAALEEMLEEGPIDSGAGLSPALLESCARDHGGFCSHEQVPGEGTTLHIDLPLLG